MPRPLAIAAALTAVLASPSIAPAAAQDGGGRAKCAALDWSCPDHPGGSRERAIERPGGAGAYAGFRRGDVDDDLCARVAAEHRAYVPYGHGGDTRYFAVWADLGGERPKAVMLACGVEQEVWGLTAGPGDGEWLRCPGESHPVDRGAAWTVSASRAFAQTLGGFGYEHDGYWDYRFYNPEAGTVRARLYGICERNFGAMWD